MWSSSFWLFGRPRTSDDKSKNSPRDPKRKPEPAPRSSSEKHCSSSRSPIREELVQKALNFLSHSDIRDSPELHVTFLKNKGLSAKEIQEALNRLNVNDDDGGINYDPLTVLPPLYFEEFLFEIHQPKYAHVLASFENFAKMFESGILSGYSEEEISQITQNQIGLISDELIELHRVYHVRMAPLIVSECVEKYLTITIYDHVFAPSISSAKEDEALQRKIFSLSSFLRPEHLDIPKEFVDPDLWSVAQQELLNINGYKAPRDKLVCIVKACKILFSAVQLLAHNQPVSADTFLPILIYNIVKANPPQLKSNVKYVVQYRPQSKMQHESGYLFVSFSTAITFLESADVKSFTVDPEEYNRHVSKLQKSPSTAAREEQLRLEEATKYDANEHLLQSCAAGDIDMVKFLIEKEGAKVDYAKQSCAGFTADIQAPSTFHLGDFPLAVACRYGNVEVIRYLLQKGAPVDATDRNGRTVLHLECVGHELGKDVFYNRGVIKLLLRFGASRNLKDKYDKTPVDYAKESGIEGQGVSFDVDQSEISGKISPEKLMSGDSSSELSSSSAGVESLPDPLFLVHPLQEGDTISSIAAQYRVEEEEIKKFNNIPLERELSGTLSENSSSPKKKNQIFVPFASPTKRNGFRQST
eukprot:TRINITY_DN4553_c0_g1_i1.p1 TRINITY_DN4553_c0_g1~~TRINITY_DN4553_c0_g1_i1.p1  ORF type:complete len:642 (-),score=156.84 TRINITY_DN4553_c0_g1_i1:6-1931(-)